MWLLSVSALERVFLCLILVLKDDRMKSTLIKCIGNTNLLLIYFCGLAYSGHFIYMESYNIWPISTGFTQPIFSVPDIVACVRTSILFIAK